MIGICTLTAVVATVIILGRKLRLRGLAEWGTFAYTATTSLVLGYGYLLSSGGLLGTAAAWLAAAVCGAALTAVVCALSAALSRDGTRADSAAPAGSGVSAVRRDASPGRRALGPWLLLVPAGLTAFAVAGASLHLACATAPCNYDSLNCHLPRAAYFCEHGDLSNYPANHWGQSTHPRNQPILLVFAFLVGGEKATQLVQFVAYLAVVVAVYGVSRRLGTRRTAAGLAALLTALLTNLVLESRTTQNDLLVAAGVAVTVYCILSFREEPARRYIWLSVLALAGMLGVKGSAALALPAVGVVAAWTLWPYLRRHAHLSRPVVLHFAGASLLLVLLLLPMGYGATMVAEGHPLGGAGVQRMHTFAGLPADQAAAEAGKNVLRFGIDLCSLDGLPPFSWLDVAQREVRECCVRTLTAVGLDLTTQPCPLPPFDPDRPTFIMEDYAYWGVCTLVFVLPALGYCVLRPFKIGPAALLPAAFAVFLLCQAAGGPYDPFRGRYFSWGAVLVMPAVAVWLDRWLRSSLALVYLCPAVLLCCLSGASSVLCNPFTRIIGADVVSGQRVIRTAEMDRESQVSRMLPGFEAVMRNFEAAVPPNSVVAVSLSSGAFEYPFFGPHWTRKLIPAPPGDGAVEARATAGKAQFLLYNSGVMPPAPTDVMLGTDAMKNTFCLRRLP